MMESDRNFRRLTALAAVAGVLAWKLSSADSEMRIDNSGTITIDSASVPLPEILSEGSKQVLLRTSPTEGPGAPVPLPSDISDMAELRRVYNENLQPKVDHMRDIFPVEIEETTIDGISAAIVTPKDGEPERNKHRLILNGPGGGFRTGVRANGLLISIPMAATTGVRSFPLPIAKGLNTGFGGERRLAQGLEPRNR
jgi:hypothetical protein